VFSSLTDRSSCGVLSKEIPIQRSDTAATVASERRGGLQETVATRARRSVSLLLLPKFSRSVCLGHTIAGSSWLKKEGFCREARPWRAPGRGGVAGAADQCSWWRWPCASSRPSRCAAPAYGIAVAVAADRVLCYSVQVTISPGLCSSLRLFPSFWKVLSSALGFVPVLLNVWFVILICLHDSCRGFHVWSLCSVVW
jgi:hypothetical protein